MKRRNFLIGAGTAAIGGSALLGSGAFSEIQAQRSVTVQVAEDPNAYLGMDDCQNSDGQTTPNSSFALIDDDGHLQIDMTDTNPTGSGGETGEGGTGVNSESISWFDNVFQICNQGKEDVCLWLSDKRGADPGRVTFYVDGESRDGTATPERFVDDPLATREQAMNDDGIQTFNGVDDSIPIALGDCVCVGIEVYTREDSSFEITNPSAGDQLLDGVTITADTSEGDCFGEVTELCPVLSGEYQCTIYAQEGTDNPYQRTGTRMFIENTGDVATPFRIATADSPPDWRTGLTVNPNATREVVVDASVPQESLIIWDPGPDCIEQEGFQTWGEYKDQFSDVDNLDDWYAKFGAGSSPFDAPATLDDGVAVVEKTIPEESKSIANTIGPDSSIPASEYPDMSQAAEDEGWIACGKL